MSFLVQLTSRLLVCERSIEENARTQPRNGVQTKDTERPSHYCTTYGLLNNFENANTRYDALSWSKMTRRGPKGGSRARISLPRYLDHLGKTLFFLPR